MVSKKDLIKEIQQCIDNDKFKITHLETYDPINKIETSDIILNLITEPNGRRDVIMEISDIDIDSKYISNWKKTPLGKFLIKDWKKDIKDRNGNIPYYCLEIVYKNSHLKILIRNLIEVNECASDKNSEQIEMLKNAYNDLILDNNIFSIIKIIDDEDGSSWKTKDKYFKLEKESKIIDFSSIIETEEEEPPTLKSIEDKISINPLF